MGRRKDKAPQGAAPPPESIAQHLVDLRRRGFLTGTLAAGAIAGAASLVRAGDVQAAAPAPDGRSPHYRETEHIRRAYDRMRF